MNTYIWHELVVKMFSFNRLWMKKTVSHPSKRASISAASVERLTVFILLEFKAVGVDLFLPQMKTTYPPWACYRCWASCWSLHQSIGEFLKNQDQMIVFWCDLSFLDKLDDFVGRYNVRNGRNFNLVLISQA